MTENLTPAEEQKVEFAIQLARQNKVEEAANIAEEMYAKAPSDLNVMLLLAEINIALTNYSAAHELLTQLTQAIPEHPNILGRLGYISIKLEDFNAAQHLLEKSTSINPDALENQFFLALVYQHQNKWQAAKQIYLKYGGQFHSPPVLQYAGNGFFEDRDFDNAIKFYELALKSDPSQWPLYASLSQALYEQLTREETPTPIQLSKIHEFYRLASPHLEANNGLIQLLFAEANAQNLEGHFPAAITCYRKILEMDSGNTDTEINLGVALLATRQLKEGWRYYQSRKKYERENTGIQNILQLGVIKPEWQGQPIPGKTLLVTSEQGIGDHILHAQHLLALSESDTRIILTCNTKLVSLFKRSFPQFTVLSDQEQIPVEHLKTIDYYTTLIDIPEKAGVDLDDYTAPNAYLNPDPSLSQKIKQDYQNRFNKPTVGIAWKSLATTGGLKSIPLEQLTPLLRLPQVQFISLQYDATVSDIEEFNRKQNTSLYVDNSFDPYEDIEHAAAQIDAVNLVISISNACVHLAGSMGKPVWLLLHTKPIWHWFSDGKTSPWYPSIETFRQNEPLKWDSVITEVKNRLQNHLEKKLPFEPKHLLNTETPIQSTTPHQTLKTESGIDPSVVARAYTFLNENKLADANKIIRKLCTERPNDPECLLLQAEQLYLENNFHAAISLLRDSCEQYPNNGHLLGRLAYGLLKTNELNEAKPILEKSTQLNPEKIDNQLYLAVLYQQVGEWEAAASLYKTYAELFDSAPVLCQAASGFLSENDIVTAKKYYRVAAKSDPTMVTAYIGLAQALYAELNSNPHAPANLINEINTACKKANTLPLTNNEQVDLLLVKGNTLSFEGKFPEAIEIFRTVLKLDGKNSEAKNNLALALLRTRNFSEGWPLFRKRNEFAAQNLGLKSLTNAGVLKPEWDETKVSVEALSGKTLLVTSEQGVGDQIMHSQHLLTLLEHNINIILTCNQKLVSLFQRSFPNVMVLPDSQPIAPELIGNIDYYSSLIDIAQKLAFDPSHYRSTQIYLKADETLVNSFKDEYRKISSKPKIGLAWQSQTPGGAQKSIELEQFKYLIKNTNFDFISIQYNADIDEIQRFNHHHQTNLFVDKSFNPYTDLEKATAQIAALDLIISISNASVHIAGALGKPVWLLTPTRPMWHWFDSGTDSPWYPTIEIFRQVTPLNWTPVLKQIKRRLNKVGEEL
ncbi:hypothetical protein OLMES_3107 [Oleiphilus messinensis]|uniref:TPR repeat-containing protein n=1 Tax=Oleiphilus messinensis TaxID=141451 RepID=A0A1Y0IA77_9GAMM|nr:tetratricopeptide repeat protein [Oleiphilus messinensis]ARU57150.1 hypothetical protein OLMES_3107 [Oleiphilus messinensis]